MAKQFFKVDATETGQKIIVSDEATDFLKTVCGRKKILAICMWGKTRNGKSTFLNTIISYLENRDEFLNFALNIKDIFPSEFTDSLGVTKRINFFPLYLNYFYCSFFFF